MIKRLNNITFSVSDLNEITQFYEKILGLKKQSEWPTYVIFDCNGVDLAFQPGGRKNKKEGPHLFFLVDDVDEEYQKLKNKGVVFKSEPEDKPWGGRVALLKDPDGNKLCIWESKER